MVFYGQSVNGRPNGGHYIFITAACMVSFSGVFVLLRCWHRYITAKAATRPQDKKQFKGDDLTIILALLASIALTCTLTQAVDSGYGQHQWDLTEEQVKESLKIFYFAEICFWACCGLTKLSMILLYQRIFQEHFGRLGYFCIGVTLFWLHLTVLASVFQCGPIRAVWDLDLLGAPNVRCLNRRVLSDALAIVNTVMHCLLFVLPIFPLRRLKLPERQTMMLCITFGICALAGGFSLYRTVCILRHQMVKGDATWTGECQAMCDALEANIAIICPCLPMVPSLINHHFPNVRLFRGLKSCEAQAVPGPRGRGRERERDVEATAGAGNAAAATHEVQDVHGGNESLGTYSVAATIPKQDTEEREDAEEEEETCASATACASDQGTVVTSEAGASATQISQSASSYSYCSRSWTTVTGSFGTEYEGEPRPDTSRYETALERRQSVRCALDPVEPTLAQPRI